MDHRDAGDRAQSGRMTGGERRAERENKNTEEKEARGKKKKMGARTKKELDAVDAIERPGNQAERGDELARRHTR